MSPLPPIVMLTGLLAVAKPIDWPALTQTPHERKHIPDPGLTPLLVEPGGEKVTTKAGWEKQRVALRDKWLAHLGPAPETPAALDVKAEKPEQQDGFTRTLVSFAAEGDDRIRAYLLVPDGSEKGKPRAAVVAFHETTRDTFRQPAGVAGPPSLALGVHLARRGYVVLCPECYILKDPKGWVRGQAEALAARRPGWTGMGKMVFDGSRCVDYLETLAEVDKERIGCIGFSLGSKEAMYAVAFEPRFKAGVANEGGVGLTMSNWFDPWYLGAKMKEKVPAADNDEVLALAAPRALLIQAGGSADGDASWAFVRAALPVYELYGARDHLGLHDHGGKHSYPREGRRVAYRWLDHWLTHTPTRDEVGP